MIEDDPSDEKPTISYRINEVEDREGNEGFEIAAFDTTKKISPEEFCQELEYFIQHARKDGFSVFENLKMPDNNLH